MNSPTTFARVTEALPAEIVFEVLPRDLSDYRAGNTGIPYAFFFDSGLPGPRVAINALTHGNEFCGMVAVCALLDAGVRPECGSLSLSFANVAAYESFDINAPFDSRQLVHNLNRIWSQAELTGSERSPELDRAREMRSLFDGAHALLDIHSTTQPVPPFFVLSAGQSSRASIALADGIGFPAPQLIMPGGMQTGTPLIEYGPFSPIHAKGTTAFAPGAGGSVVVECGQHFAKSAGVLATQVALSFMRHTGVLSSDGASKWSVRLTGIDAFAARPAKPQRYQLLSTHVIRTPQLRWARPLQGMEVFARDELIGTDGDFEIRSPCNDCTIFMPLAPYRTAIPGREGIYLTMPVASNAA
ncbi:MAG: succinylglutamate desuccinylase [Betaproteobacteria bacterium]|nr:MAG: succinylglutamate desuccinylase [Betaproteobacteria bacterium]